MNTSSVHLLVELHGCDPHLLMDIDYMNELMEQAAHVAGATIVAKTSHRYSPEGVCIVVVLKESHFSIHTWPEVGYAAVDFFTCGNCCPEQAVPVLNTGLRASRAETLRVLRGQCNHVPSAFVTNDNP